MNENHKPQAQVRPSNYASSRKETIMKTALKTLIATLALSALLSSAVAQSNYHAPTLKDYAIASGVIWIEPVALADLPQFSDTRIESLAEIATVVADRHHGGDVVAACESLSYIFESLAQMNREIAVLTES